MLEQELEHMRAAIVHLTAAAVAQSDALGVSVRRQERSDVSRVFALRARAAPPPAATVPGRRTERMAPLRSDESTGPRTVRGEDVEDA